MNKVIFSPEAVKDLEDIWLYIAQDSPDRADNFVDKLRDSCMEDLALSPKIGSKRNYLSKDLLALPFKNYMIYYRCRSAQVQIVRVLHGSKDMGAIFNRSE
ncbi:MAG: type II toxin-antitoxin system RelE/ParE family toxin [Candidatus Electrothrix sp. AR1]|nr:type II toxin-antitoxin system RelE/ParE family toxin [Candidatus Electrothrix sp. AR1]